MSTEFVEYPRITNYKIVRSSDLSEVEAKVLELLKDGWDVLGACNATNTAYEMGKDVYISYSQTMVKYSSG